ncbi:MAG TPA: IclR family transcriptional regulator [Syntrophorhabdaceae bacterium]|nr:IclR family transcriptional regulator [Syntrophorhabdaceae bacterium]HOT41646.1 IclR family transcriptional regulator [Syntrophorhabdaceae bacterium]HPC67154.1 IclR family transcriptional regulator [Syntrophorhabdaceae bacterium]HQE80025.1 IclR family transcriptional regulator [Syntrophorhabdaceae bacterium]HQH42543.1 IclR family transcriptional regulator [Syntrophorhabdaceae bacterium]
MYNAPIIRKAFDIIKLMVEDYNPLGVTEISKRLSISKSTVFGILKALEDENLITKDNSNKKYLIGPGLFELSKKVFKGGELSNIARPFLERLVGYVDETVFLCIRENDNIETLDVIEAKKAVKISSPVGTKIPITASVLCKIFLSPMKNDDIRDFLLKKGLPKYTENSITDIDRFIEEIEKTRKLGYSLDLEEYLRGVRALATLLYYGDGTLAGAICIVGFSRSIKDEKLPMMIQHLKNTTQLINQRLSQLNIK